MVPATSLTYTTPHAWRVTSARTKTILDTESVSPVRWHCKANLRWRHQRAQYPCCNVLRYAHVVKDCVHTHTVRTYNFTPYACPKWYKHLLESTFLSLGFRNSPSSAWRGCAVRPQRADDTNDQWLHAAAYRQRARHRWRAVSARAGNVSIYMYIWGYIVISRATIVLKPRAICGRFKQLYMTCVRVVTFTGLAVV